MADKLGDFLKNRQPAPKLSRPMPEQPIEPTPVLLKPEPVQKVVPPPKLTVPMPVQALEPAPTLSVPGTTEFQGPPNLVQPTPPDFQPPPNLVRPTPPPPMPAPPLVEPEPTVFEPPPALVQPELTVFQPPPNLVQPTPTVFEPPPVLLTPEPTVFEPPPVLSVTGTTVFQGPPNLSVTGTIDFQPPPRVQVFHGSRPHAGDQPTAIGNPYKSFISHQKDYFDKVLPQTVANLVNRVLPKPGNIDVDALPSTVFTKALNVANAKIIALENKYGYNVVSDVSADVSRRISSVLGVNSAPDGAVENNPNLSSLQKINDDFRNNPRAVLTDLFNAGSRVNLRSNYKGTIKSDPKYQKFQGATQQYRVLNVDDDSGLLKSDVKLNVAAKTVYFPFYIVDLRPDSQKKYRTVFFQPMNLTISENFSPSWNEQNFMGRVDPVATYQNTTRSINISFKMVALHPADVPLIYGKLKWLTSMVYPEFTPSMRYKSGPVVKLRVGDVLNAVSVTVPLSSDRPGVPGFINSLDYTYDNLWEVEDDWQVPRGVDVSFGFTVLHELPVGIVDGAFGGIGSIDNTSGIYYSPQSNSDAGRDQGSVDDRSFRRVGPDAQGSSGD